MNFLEKLANLDSAVVKLFAKIYLWYFVILLVIIPVIAFFGFGDTPFISGGMKFGLLFLYFVFVFPFVILVLLFLQALVAAVDSRDTLIEIRQALESGSVKVPEGQPSESKDLKSLHSEVAHIRAKVDRFVDFYDSHVIQTHSADARKSAP